MGFLGGFLIFMAILLMLGITVGCTFGAVVSGSVEAYWIAALLWACCMFVFLNILGTGIALCQVRKLKKRVRQLEDRLISIATAPAAPSMEYSAVPKTDYTSAPLVGFQDNWAPPAPKKRRVWIPITIIICVLSLCGIAAVFLLMNAPATLAPAAPVATQASVMEAPPAEAPPATEAAPATEAPASPAPSSQNAEMGSTISTDFVEITLTNLLVAEDIKHSVKSGHITYTTGPEPVAGQKYICISGTIRNTSNAPLPVYDFFLGDFELDGYHYQVDATDCDILDGEGSPVTNIDPLMEYTIRIYVAIPNSLADNHGSCIFSFGFFDHFDNQELAYNRSFAEDPIALCPYRYTLTLK